MTIEQAVQLAKNGKEEGFTFLYKEFYRQKFYLALQYTKDESLAEDVMQDAYVRAFQHIDDLLNPAAFGSWFGQIVVRTALNAVKKQKNVVLSFEETSADGEEFEIEIPDVSVDNQPELSYSRKETQELVQEMVNSLSDEQRFCVMMFYMENMPIKEIAQTLECSENTVKSRLNYGRKNLEKKGEELKKKGYQLYSVAPMPLLILLMKKESAFAATATGAAGASVPQASKVLAKYLAKGKMPFMATAAGKATAIAVAVVVAGGATTGGVMALRSHNENVSSASVNGEKNTQDNKEQDTNTNGETSLEFQVPDLPKTEIADVDWISAYNEIIESVKATGGYTTELGESVHFMSGGTNYEYTLLDIDCNGIPEIYFRNGDLDTFWLKFAYVDYSTPGEYTVLTVQSGQIISDLAGATLYTDPNFSTLFQVSYSPETNEESYRYDIRMDNQALISESYNDAGVVGDPSYYSVGDEIRNSPELYHEVLWNTLDTPLRFENAFSKWWIYNPYDLGDLLNQFPEHTGVVLFENSFEIAGSDDYFSGAFCDFMSEGFPGQHSETIQKGNCTMEDIEHYIDFYAPVSVEEGIESSGYTIYHLIDCNYLGFTTDMYLIWLP